MGTKRIEVTDERISELRVKAAAAHDIDQVMICDWALNGNAQALRICQELAALEAAS